MLELNSYSNKPFPLSQYKQKVGQHNTKSHFREMEKATVIIYGNNPTAIRSQLLQQTGKESRIN